MKVSVRDFKSLVSADLDAPIHLPGEIQATVEEWRAKQGYFFHLFTGQERRVASLVARGWSNKRISQEVGITEGTVKFYLSRLMQRLDIEDRYELAMFWNTAEILMDTDKWIKEHKPAFIEKFLKLIVGRAA
jgi:DNA-binding NarL/FixJ family response regulator